MGKLWIRLKTKTLIIATQLVCIEYCFSSFAVLGWRTSSSTALEMMLMWFQTQRFVELLQSYFFVSFRGMQLMLTEFFFTFRTSRSF